MTNKNDIETLVRKFVENKASEEEIELLQEYFKTPIGLRYLDQIISEYAGDFDKAHLAQSTNDPLDVTQNENGSSHFTIRRLIRTVAAAVVGLTILAGGYSYFSWINSQKIFKTIAGQKTTITLPDNTIVTLNGNSSLSYRDNWDKEVLRSVTLSGEGYFKVTSNAQKPFVVNTSGILIKVLGTTFNVKSYDEDEAVETTLVEGKVVIEQEGDANSVTKGVELFPAHKATFSKQSKQIVTEAVKPESEASWVKGSLIFEDETFAEIIKDLERWYGVKISVSNGASMLCRFNTTIEDESLEDVLKLFSSGGGVTYRIKGQQVWIEGALCEEKTK